jgi:hypothetical protein
MFENAFQNPIGPFFREQTVAVRQINSFLTYRHIQRMQMRPDIQFFLQEVIDPTIVVSGDEIDFDPGVV